MPTPDELRKALKAGDPAVVRALIAAGADIRYRTESDYDALVDTAYGRNIARAPRLLELLTLLVEHGVNLSGVTTYNESGLRILSQAGRFDAVRLLLLAGADWNLLGWTRLHFGIALRLSAEVRAALDAGDDLEIRDSCDRTAWLLALVAGDVGIAAEIRDRGADVAASGRLGSPLIHAIQSRNPEMVRWLVHTGADVNEQNASGFAPLGAAVYADDLATVEVLLAAGADPDAGEGVLGRALAMAGLSDSIAGSFAPSARNIITRLLAAGADPAGLSCSGHRVLAGLPPPTETPLDGITPAAYWRDPTRRFGRTNPERMCVPLWEAAIRSGLTAYQVRRRITGDTGRPAVPGWCSERYGQSLTLLPDGRAVQIGGEHEDWYDPDFCIYNDVFVHHPDGTIEIYGYPEDVFPPTDFHTATLAGDAIIVIGSLGYPDARRPGETPVHRLNLKTMRFDRVDVAGESPGWIFRHRADVVADGIRVSGGKVFTPDAGGAADGSNPGTFVLDLHHRRWRREPGAG